MASRPGRVAGLPSTRSFRSSTLSASLSVSPPAAPTGVAATNGTDGAKVQVTWTASAGATAYEVWRNTSYSTGTATKVSTTDVTGATRFDDTTAAPGRVYWYWVKAKNAGGTSGFGLGNPGYRTVPAPVNDSFDNRIGLSGSAVTTTGTNAGATKEAGEPVHAGNGGGRSVWWSWTAPSNGAVTIDTLGSSFNTLLAVYTGSSLSGLTRVPNGSNDDRPAGGTRASKVTFAVTAGTVYQIAVDGYYGLTGTVALNIKLV